MSDEGGKARPSMLTSILKQFGPPNPVGLEPLGVGLDRHVNGFSFQHEVPNPPITRGSMAAYILLMVLSAMTGGIMAFIAPFLTDNDTIQAWLIWPFFALGVWYFIKSLAAPSPPEQNYTVAIPTAKLAESGQVYRGLPSAAETDERGRHPVEAIMFNREDTRRLLVDLGSLRFFEFREFLHYAPRFLLHMDIYCPLAGREIRYFPLREKGPIILEDARKQRTELLEALGYPELAVKLEAELDEDLSESPDADSPQIHRCRDQDYQPDEGPRYDPSYQRL